LQTILKFWNKGRKLANIKSQKKRNRQNEKRRLKNVSVRSSIRTAGKKVVKIIDSKDEKSPEMLQEILKNYVKTIDTAASKGILKKTTAARKKSRLAKKVNTALQQSA
jgi:small subunit ribosomal protein S20